MGSSINSIPSINVPLTDKEGRINPIWHEFFRSFIADSLEANDDNDSSGVTVTAGAGLTGGGDITSNISLSVGAGSGIEVNADDVSVDIVGQDYVQVAYDDELMIADTSDNQAIRKAKVRDITALAGNPGGQDTQIQYNDNGVFEGDTGFTTDGAGNVTITQTLTLDKFKIFSGSTADLRFDGVTGSSNPSIKSTGDGGFTLSSATSATDVGSITFRASGPPWITINFSGGDQIALSGTSVNTDGGFKLVGKVPLRRALETNLSANTIQTQGNGALTRDYNNVTTVTNANDVVTLPIALSGRYCLVRNSGANILQVYPASGDDLGFGTNTSMTLRPGEQASWFAIDGTTWYQIEGTMKRSVASSITASTTQTQGQQPLTKDVNEVSTVANANDTVTLPTAPSYSRTVTIINNGANTLQIFPASGDNLGAGVDTATTLASGNNVQFINYDATNWEVV